MLTEGVLCGCRSCCGGLAFARGFGVGCWLLGKGALGSCDGLAAENLTSRACVHTCMRADREWESMLVLMVFCRRRAQSLSAAEWSQVAVEVTAGETGWLSLNSGGRPAGKGLGKVPPRPSAEPRLTPNPVSRPHLQLAKHHNERRRDRQSRQGVIRCVAAARVVRAAQGPARPEGGPHHPQAGHPRRQQARHRG